ncbi:MAG TPA: DinB family protein [Bryobacteraceae bacterium]|nr:DinB family protein [Bryobacteraceae bacterium]
MSEIPDLLERLRRGAELVAVSITGAAGSEVDYVPEPGKWSIRQIVAHLSDAEIVATMRVRQLIAEENPKLEAWDENAWAANLDYARRKPSQSLETFRRIRGENYELLKDLPAAAFDRAGQHSQRGQITLRQLLQLMAEHAENHAAQLRARRAEFKTFKAGAK